MQLQVPQEAGVPPLQLLLHLESETSAAVPPAQKQELQELRAFRNQVSAALAGMKSEPVA